MDARKLTLADLREIVADGTELAKGAKVYDDGGLKYLSRHEGKLFADAAGSGASPYKVQILFEDAKVRGRCSCMAARSRPICKHAAALLVAWSRAPESFAVSETPPQAAPGEGKKRDVKKGKTDGAELMRHGVDQVSALVRELAVSGVATLAADRSEQVRALGEALRENKLRRLSARTLELASVLQIAATRSSAFDAEEYADLLADLLLTARKLEKHLAGETLDDRYVEELIGKTWTKKDRRAIEGLGLLEYAFLSRVTADGFVIRDSRFLDLVSGEHFSEKQILPGFLAKRTDPKRSWAGRVLRGAWGSVYPSFSPQRLDLESAGTEEILSPAPLESVLARCIPDVARALAALQERRRDVFAPELLPVAVLVDTILAEGSRMQAIDASGAALFLPADALLEEKLSSALHGARLRAILGDVGLDGALPTLFPLALLVDVGGRLELHVLGFSHEAAVQTGKKVRLEAILADARSSRVSWADVARAAGVSKAAIVLGELRAELADALAGGLAGFGARVAEPLAARLRELSLTKQADLLQDVGGRAEPAEKLDDFVKVHQVLAIALTRLAGATQVDRASIEPVPTFESITVHKPERLLSPAEVTERALAGQVSRFEAAVHYARWYERIDPAELATKIYPTWADGSASRFVARALASRPREAVAAARHALGLDAQTDLPAWRRPRARVARLTAIRVLELVADDEARRTLVYVAQHGEDPVLRRHAERAVRATAGDRSPKLQPKDLHRHLEALFSAPNKETRRAAIDALVASGDVEVIPHVRASFFGDVSGDVRERAAYALTELGDVDSVETFLRMLRRRGEDDAHAKLAAYALGFLGDVRGVEALIDAWAEGWKPAVVAEAMRQIGSAAAPALLARVEKQPELAERKAVQSILEVIPADDLHSLLTARLEELATAEDFASRALPIVALAAAHEAVAKSVARKILSLRPNLRNKRATAEEKSLARRCNKLVGTSE
jgi:hypothetical protein